MASPFQEFVNKELPMRISTVEDGDGTGNLPVGRILLTTGVGLSVRTAESAPADVAEFTTLLTVTESVTPGASFFVNGSGTYYVKEKEDGDLGESSNAFLYNEKIQIYLNGNKVVKGESVTWTSQYSFAFGFALDPGDYIEVIS